MDETPTLSEDKVDKAMALVDKLHPLNKTPLIMALPMLAWFSGCCSKVNEPLPGSYSSLGRSETLRRQQMESDSDDNKTDSDQGEDEQKENDAQQRIAAMAATVNKLTKKDPIMIYGAGVANYFRLMRKLLLIFFILTILACFQMGIFRSFDGFGNLEEFVSITAVNSFGNIGFSNNVCAKAPCDWLDTDHVELNVKCQETTTITGILDSGMMLDDAFPGGTFDGVHQCSVYYDNPLQANSYEMKQFRKDNFNALFMERCGGKTTCSADFLFSEIATSPPWLQRLNTLLFVQVECTQTEEMVQSKNVWGLAAACIGLFMCMFFSISIRLLINTDEISEKQMDLKLVTVDDYTAQTRLDPKIYQDFMATRNLGPSDVPIMRFKQEMIESIRQQLTTNGNLTYEQTAIVDIHFAFNNVELTDKLTERAELLR